MSDTLPRCVRPGRVLASRRHLPLWVAALALTACGQSTTLSDGGVDATVMLDATLDAAPVDSGWDADVLDAGMRDGSSTDATTTDAGDAALEDAGFDSGFDAGPSCEETCVSEVECLVPQCDEGVCSLAPAPDGTDCGEPEAGLPTGVCLSGSCVMPRGCGDGYREPGPIGGAVRPAPERCDDGNSLDGDTCSATCEPTAVGLTSVGVDPVTDEETLSVSNSSRETAAIGVDGRGSMLVVWTEERFPFLDDPYSLGRAQRFDAAGVPVGDIVDLGMYVDLSVAGVGEGWAVAADSSELLYVAPDASVTMASVLPADTFDVSLRRVDTDDGPGALLVYGIDSGRSLRQDAEVRAQRWGYRMGRLSRLSDHLVASSVGRRTWHVSATTHGTDWAVHFATRSPIGDSPDVRDVRIRRYAGATELDVSPQVAFTGVTTDYAAGIGYTAATGDTGYALALITNDIDVLGDIALVYVQPDGSSVSPTVVDDTSTSSAIRALRLGAHPIGEGAYLLMQHDSSFSGLTLYTGTLNVAAAPRAVSWSMRAQSELMALAPAFALYDSSLGMPSMVTSGDALWIFWSGYAFGHAGMHLYPLRD